MRAFGIVVLEAAVFLGLFLGGSAVAQTTMRAVGVDSQSFVGMFIRCASFTPLMLWLDFRFYRRVPGFAAVVLWCTFVLDWAVWSALVAMEIVPAAQAANPSSTLRILVFAVCFGVSMPIADYLRPARKKRNGSACEEAAPE